MIDQTYTSLMAMPHPWDWLEKQVKSLSASKEEFMEGDAMARIWSLIGEKMEKAIKMEEEAIAVLCDSGLDRLAEKVEKEELPQYKEMADAYDATYTAVIGE